MHKRQLTVVYQPEEEKGQLEGETTYGEGPKTLTHPAIDRILQA